jgi:hypothetical protein
MTRRRVDALIFIPVAAATGVAIIAQTGRALETGRLLS